MLDWHLICAAALRIVEAVLKSNDSLFRCKLQAGDAQCLKVLENAHDVGNCGDWMQLHVGVCRKDSNNFVFDKQTGTLKSNLCPLKCLGVGTSAARPAAAVASLMLCTAGGALGWSEVMGPG